MIQLSCLCGQVRAETPRPDFVHECNCALCRKTGARWAYFHPSQVTVTGRTTGYSRQDKRDPSARACFCTTCGSTTHFHLTDSAIERFGNAMMGVNMALADEHALVGIELRFPDGLSWAGAGEFTYVRHARIIGQEAGPV